MNKPQQTVAQRGHDLRVALMEADTIVDGIVQAASDERVVQSAEGITTFAGFSGDKTDVAAEQRVDDRLLAVAKAHPSVNRHYLARRGFDVDALVAESAQQ